MQKKFALTNETRVISNQILYRIKALKDFSDVKAGDLGGFVEKEDNLSHDGNCWVYDDACIYNNAYVSDNATVFNYARVFDNAVVSDNVYVCYSVKIFGNAIVDGNQKIYDDIGNNNKTINEAA
ncbi:hypothetical protein [Bartonella sp. AP58NXGY]|uniref:hypothetical protein n=1 Tax=Bartonella sp. AP58NXGY TaxID=3243498 RepID=UPI0035CF3E12